MNRLTLPDFFFFTVTGAEMCGYSWALNVSLERERLPVWSRASGEWHFEYVRAQPYLVPAMATVWRGKYPAFKFMTN